MFRHFKSLIGHLLFIFSILTSGVSTGVVSGVSMEVYDERVGKDYHFYLLF